MRSAKKSLLLQLLIHLPGTHQMLCRPVPSFRHRGGGGGGGGNECHFKLNGCGLHIHNINS